MIFVYNYGTPLTTAQATALNSFVALATTPAGNHLAKDSNGEFVNTPDTGGGGSGITTLNTLTATTQTFADVDDTNVTLAINSATSTHTFTLGWTGTLAASRLNANVVQAVSNDTNVTGSIGTQTLTLGWTGTLAASRGGLGANLSSLTTNNLVKYNGTNFVDSLLAGTVSGARAIIAGTLTGDRTYTLPDTTGTVALLDNPTFTTRINTPVVRAVDTAGILFESANGTDVGLLGAANTANATWYGAHNFGGAVSPSTTDGAALGSTGNQWADLFLAEGGVINWDNGDVTLTQTGNNLVLAGGEFSFGANTAGFDVTDNGNSGTSDTIDWKLGNKQKSTFTGNCTFTFTAPTKPCSLILECVQDGTARTITWPSTVKWSGGTAPTFTGTSGRSDIVTFYYNGSVYYGNSTLNFVNS